MDVSRAEKISEVMKNVTGLGKSIKKPTNLKYNIPRQPGVGSRLPEPVAGSQVIRILMILIASLLLIGIILLGVDQWITPIFQRAPGDSGFIPVPGIDESELYWTDSKAISNIRIGTVTPDASGLKPLSTNVIENQGNYTITIDIMINDEYPQALGNDATGNPIKQRTFFLLGPSVTNPTLQVSLDNLTNTVIITAVDTNKLVQSIQIDNVPIHKPFRIGIAKSSYIMEGYLNGLLVKTRQLKTTTILPGTGDTIYTPANIIINGNSVSNGINVFNVRLFGYTVTASEMKGRMTDGLLDPSSIAWTK